MLSQIAELDDKIKDPLKNFGYVSGSQGQRRYATSSADHFVPYAGVAQMNLNPHLSQLLGLSAPGQGNKLSRAWNSIFDPKKAFQQYLAIQGAVPDRGMVRGGLGSGNSIPYAPLDINNLDELYTHGVSTGFITQADLADPAIVQRKLADLAKRIHFDQGNMVSKLGGNLSAAADALNDTKMKMKVGGGVAGTLAAVLGATKAVGMYNESQASKAKDAKAKADAAKARAKLVGDATKKLFGDRRGKGFDALMQMGPGGKPSDAALKLWDMDVDELVGIGRSRMFSKLSPDQQRLAMQRLQSWEGQKKSALQAMASGSANITDYPDIASDLKNFGTEYGIDFSKTPYVGQFAGEDGNISGGLMLDMENPEGPMRRWGYKRGSVDLTDFAEESAMMGE